MTAGGGGEGGFGGGGNGVAPVSAELSDYLVGTWRDESAWLRSGVR